MRLQLDAHGKHRATSFPNRIRLVGFGGWLIGGGKLLQEAGAGFLATGD